MRLTTLAAPALIGALMLGGCGGGGGGSAADGGPVAGTATVGVLVTDAPVGRWDEAIATITSVTLIGGPGQVTLFEGEQTLDLLELGDFSEYFAVSDAVPAGSYSKIRLQLADLVLNDRDEDGTLIESVRPQLVGNGKIDLNPRGSFDLAPGDVVVVELDFDMEKSLKITETGNGRLIVRPVVFVDISTRQVPDARLTRIHGEITRIDDESQDFHLCQTEFASRWDDDEAGHDDDDDDDDGDRRCVLVRTGEGTGIFGEDGLPQDFADLAVGEQVTAIGRLRPLSDEEEDNDDDDDDDDRRGDDDRHFALDAFVIEEGPLGTFRRVRGTVASDFDAGTSRFDLDLAPGQGIETEDALPVQLFEKSRVFNRSGDELAAADILTGRAALADGVLVIGDDDVLRSPLVVLGDSDAPESATLEGEIVSVDEDDLSLIVNDGTMDRCVDAASAAIFLVDDSDGFSSSRGDIDDLEAGQAVSVFGVEGIDGCLSADTVLAEED